MIKKKTAFVIGAGASNDFGFPTGHELAKYLLDSMHFERAPDLYYFRNKKIPPNGARQRRYDALSSHFNASKNYERNYAEICETIRRSLNLYSSVDEFLKDHSDPVKAEIIKIAMMELIFEDEFNLFFEQSSSGTAQIQLKTTPDLHWVLNLFWILKDNCPRNQIHSLFDNISVINFNYDRSFELSLVSALHRAYSLDLAEAFEIIKQIRIIHPYGSLDDIVTVREFLAGPMSADPQNNFGLIRANSNTIRTFSEQRSETMEVKCRSLIAESERIIFLGFGFHKMNLDLLTPKIRPQGGKHTICGTVFGETKTSQKIIRNSLSNMFFTNKVQLFECTSGELLEEIRREILDS